MKSHVLKSVLFAILLTLTMASFVKANYPIGVNGGDWIIYDLEVTNLGQTIEESVNITIQTVEGVLITGTFEVTTQGQYVVPTEQFNLDVSSQIGQSAHGFIIPANLTVGNSIPGESTTVQNLTDWNGRTAVVANTSAPFLEYPSQVYWDQATGVLLQAKGSSQGLVYSITLADTSLWNSGFFGLNSMALTVLVVGFIAAVLVVYSLLIRRRKAKNSDQSTQNVEPAKISCTKN